MKARSLFTTLALALASSCHVLEQSATTSASAAPSAVRVAKLAP